MSVFIIVKAGWTFLELRNMQQRKQFCFDWPMETLTHKKMLREDTHSIDHMAVLPQYGKLVMKEPHCTIVRIRLPKEDFENLWKEENNDSVIQKTIQALNQIENKIYA